MDMQKYEFEIISDHTIKTALQEYIVDGVQYVDVDISSESEIAFPKVDIVWYHDIVDIQSYWHPGSFRSKSLTVDWCRPFSYKGTVSAPVAVFYSQDKRNRLAVAYSNALDAVEFNMGVNEETGRIKCKITLFVEPSKKMKQYKGTIRIDCRDILYDNAIKDIVRWYESMPEYLPATVPEYAKLPMYSTWYNFHQNIKDSLIIEECKTAKALGFHSVIVDDGWQTDDNNRGYAFCGDWEVCTSKFPDMRRFVDDVHALDMKCLLWYSVPFIGFKAKNYSRFENQLLYKVESLDAAVLDPRYPQVREYLINIYEDALKNYDIDGFKLDFVDTFDLRNASEEALKADGKRDTESVQEAVDMLLGNVMTRLRNIKPDVMIEFRQNYIGPCMRKYGNIFRVTDCPHNAINNRLCSLDLRLFSGNTAVHADPITWSPKDTVENAALQFINALFSIPQVSMNFAKLPEAHKEMMSYWVSFWAEHRDVLIDGHITAKSPEAQYPLIIAENKDKRVFALYEEMYINTGIAIPHKMIIVNGAMVNQLVLNIEEKLEGILKMYDCSGKLTTQKSVCMEPGLCSMNIEKSGVIVIEKE